jgi:Zinc-finger of C2H2 type
MALQHKQKVHGIDFAAVPQAVPVQVQVQPPRPPSSAACYCHVCNRSYTSTSALEQHYRDTPVHSKCARCNIGFVDDAALRAVSSLISLFKSYHNHLDMGQSTPPPSIVQTVQLPWPPSLAVFAIGPTLAQVRSNNTIVILPCIQSACAATQDSRIMPRYRP